MLDATVKKQNSDLESGQAQMACTDSSMSASNGMVIDKDNSEGSKQGFYFDSS